MARMSSFDDGAMRELLQRQDRVVSRAQVLACGMTLGALRRRIEAEGPWQRLLPGVYLTVTGTPTADQRQVAALLYAGDGSLITGVTALRRLGIGAPVRDTMTVLVPARRPRMSTSYVAIWPTTRMPSRCLVHGEVRFAMPDRATVDASRELTSLRDLRALIAEAVQKRWCSVDRLAEELRSGPQRGRAPLRDVLAEVASGVRSVPEGDLRRLLATAGLPTPMFNARLYSGRQLIAIPDAWWPDAGVAVEVDSREWHLLPDDWQRTLSRHSRMSAHGIIVLHFTPQQIRQEPAKVTAEIRSAITFGLARPPLALRTIPAQA